LLLTFAFALVSVFDFALVSVSVFDFALDSVSDFDFASTTKRHARPWKSGASAPRKDEKVFRL
jgi:hypothetical protein